MLRTKEDAEDALQLSFMKAFDKYASFDEAKASIYTWLYRITYNSCLDRISKKKEYYGSEGLIENHADYTPLQDHVLIESESNKVLMDEIDKLPENQKNSLILFYFQELKIKEAAEVMNISPKAFESLVIRARKKLKDSMIKE